jgi:hypothetical protein
MSKNSVETIYRCCVKLNFSADLFCSFILYFKFKDKVLREVADLYDIIFSDNYFFFIEVSSLYFSLFDIFSRNFGTAFLEIWCLFLFLILFLT